jgi:ubiquinone/menaquinone biosynthesis C-methylase UbiE
MILDVGCGKLALGDVNIDIDSTHKSAPNFVLAHAAYLPFRDNSFDTSLSYHVIEHMLQPQECYMLVKEMVRVTKKKVVIRCPHRFSYGAKGKLHKQYFTAGWFHKVLAKLPHRIHCVFAWSKIPFIAVPDEIVVTIYLKSIKSKD